MPAYARIRAGSTELKSNRAAIFFLWNGVPDKTCTCNVLVGRSEGRRRYYAATRHPLRPPCRTRSPAFLHCTFGGWRSQLTFGFERKWQRGASPRCRYRGVPKYEKKQPRFTTKMLCTKYIIPISKLCATGESKTGGRICVLYYIEHQGYTDVQGYAVEPRHVTFGWKLHSYNLIFVNGAGGHSCTLFPTFFPVLNISTFFSLL